MTQWINAHPWAFFWLVAFAIWAFETVGAAFAMVIAARGKSESSK